MADSALTRRARAPGRCRLGRKGQLSLQKSHTSSWKYRKHTWSRTQLRNKPTLIESVHRDTGKQATHLSWPGYLVCLEGSGWGQVGVRKQGQSGCLKQQGRVGGVGCAELRPGHVSLWVFTCVYTCVYRYTRGYNVHRIYRSPQRPICGEA